MYGCILVPLDGTPFGEAALPLAISVARRSRAVLHLTHVHLPAIIPSGAETAAMPPLWIESSWQEKRDYLEALAISIEDRWGIGVETRVMEGAVAAALERHASRCSARLVVMSTHGHAGFSRLWHHGVADQITRDLHLPVILVAARDGAESAASTRPDAAPDIENVLVLLDGSREAEQVVDHARAIAAPFGARLTLARVFAEVSRNSALALARGALDGAAAVAEAETAARQYLNALAERLRSRGARIDAELLVGQQAAAAILEYVESVAADPARRVDLLALEAPERSRVSRLLLRGTADDLVANSPLPVLVHQSVAAPEKAAVILAPGLAAG